MASQLYRDASAPVASRVEDLLSRMSIPQKVGQMLQLDARDGVRSLITERHAGSILHASPERVLEAQEVAAGTELQIPLLVADDLIHGYSFWPGATIFPTQLGMAASWDPRLVRAAGRITAIEASQTGVHWTFSPVLCVARDLRWGRIDETFGEDIFLIGELGAALASGYQGEGISDRSAILATAKHFAGYSETQGGRDASEADLSHRKLRSWFLPPFERVAREGIASFMLGYQTTDGVPITTNRWLLTEVLRGEWGYKGALVTDWDNVGRMVWEQNVQPDYAHAAAAAIIAGNDIIMTTPRFFEGALEALEAGLVSVEDIDQAVRRILTLKFQMGLFEDARLPMPPAAHIGVIGSAAHQEVNIELTRRSIVLLSNDGTLPLKNVKKVAVVGALADDAQTQLGDWAGSSGQINWMPEGHPRETITTVFDGMSGFAPDGVEVTYVQGATICHLVPDPEGDTWPDGQPRWPIAVADEPDEEMIAQAVQTALKSDCVVAVVGDSIEMVGEARSTATLELQGGQRALLDALAETGKPMIVVLLASKPLVLPDSALNAAALLWAASPGQKGGQAIAEIIYGAIEPSGRLPISFARHAGQLPVYYNQIRGQHGSRYADLTQDPAFAFGQGLGYSFVEYGPASLEQTELGLEDKVIVQVPLRNTGDRDQLETVQVYIRDVVTSVSWAARELKAYQQVHIGAGQEATVRIEVPVRDCSIVNSDCQRVVEPGEFQVLVGKSSRLEDLEALPFTVH